MGFWNVFGGFREAKWSQVGTKNASNIDLNFGRPIFPPINFYNRLFYYIFCKMGLPKLRSILGAFLVPTWLHFASQNPPKTVPKATPRGTKILIDFCIAFLSFLAPFWPPTWGQLGAQDGFKIEKMRSKNSGVAHRERFEMRPCFSTPSWAILAPFWPPTWRHFGPSWLRFGPSWLRFGFETPLLIANLRAPRDGRRSSPNGGFN